MKKRLWIGILLAAVVCLWGFYENTRLQLNSFPVNVAGLPDPFDGFRIAHISDLHNARFGENNEELIKLLNQAKPDLIALLRVSDRDRTEQCGSMVVMQAAVRDRSAVIDIDDHRIAVSIFGIPEIPNRMSHINVAVRVIPEMIIFTIIVP